MNKKILFIVLILLGINAAALFFLLRTSTVADRQDLTIAVAVPLSGPESARGREALNGINLYLDRARSEGRLDNKRITLVPYDDRKDRQTALSIANQIVEENRALLVLGHYFTSSAEIAGAVYKQRGIPAITASAAGDTISLENDWYFSVIPNNHYTSEFVAEYLYRGLGYTSASIIYDDDNYGASLARGFLQIAGNIGLKIQGNWSFDAEDDRLNNRLSTIVAQLRAMDDPGVIFCATYQDEGAKILASLMFPHTPYRVIGPDSFASPTIIEKLKAYPKERIAPGYHSNGLFTVTPFLSKISGEKGYRFVTAYADTYGESPSWVSASYHDAIQVAVQAIENAEVQGKDLKEDRRRVRDALKGLNDERVAVDGITGNIYFDSNGIYQRPPSVGVYLNQEIQPAFLQYQKSSGDSQEPKTDNEKADHPIVIEGQTLLPTRAVYGGVRFIEIRDLDVVHKSFYADFFVWFRSKGAFDAGKVLFPNAISPIRLEQPVVEMDDNGMTIRAYRVTGSFKNHLDYQRYPFDDQELVIRFRHESLQRSDLLLVPDTSGLIDADQLRQEDKATTFVLPGWKLSGFSMYQDTEAPKSGSRNVESGFSRLNIAIRIHRASLSYVLKIFLPMLGMTLFLYLTYWMPVEHPWVRAGLILVAAAMGILYQWVFGAIMERGHLHTLFTAVYGIACVTATVAVVIHGLHRIGRTRALERVLMTAKIAHPVLILAAAFWVTASYWR